MKGHLKWFKCETRHVYSCVSKEYIPSRVDCKIWKLYELVLNWGIPEFSWKIIVSRWTSRLKSLRWSTGWVARCRWVADAGDEAGWIARLPIPQKGSVRMSCLFFMGTEIDGEIKPYQRRLHMVLSTSSWRLPGVESLSRVGSLSRELDNSR